MTIEHPDFDPSVYGVDGDGEFGSEGLGLLSFIADTELTFTVSAVDADGEPLRAVIVIRS